MILNLGVVHNQQLFGVIRFKKDFKGFFKGFSIILLLETCIGFNHFEQLEQLPPLMNPDEILLTRKCVSNFITMDFRAWTLQYSLLHTHTQICSIMLVIKYCSLPSFIQLHDYLHCLNKLLMCFFDCKNKCRPTDNSQLIGMIMIYIEFQIKN